MIIEKYGKANFITLIRRKFLKKVKQEKKNKIDLSKYDKSEEEI